MKNAMKYYSLLLILFLVAVSNAQVVNETKAAATASFNKIEASDRWVNSFSNQDLVELPIGIRKTISNTQYSIGITKAVFTPEYTVLTVFCKIDLPQTDKDGNPMQLFFGANDVKLSHAGGIIGDAKLVLLGDVDIPFNDKWLVTLNGGFDMATGNMQDLTYVTIDCDGFKNLKITGAVEFSRDLIIPLEANGEVNEGKKTVAKTYYNGVTKQVPYRVKGAFSLQASNWNDILVNVNLQPFVLKAKRNGNNYDGNFQFMVHNAVLDLSDLNNHPTVNFPQYYNENALLMPNPNAWRGVYVETFEIGLPKEFKTTDSKTKNERIRIGASHLIIDKFGVSGTFYGDNVFPLNKGITSDQKSWAYSLDHIDITIAANTFVKANLNGQILLPVSKNKTDANNPNRKIGLAYNGFISMEEQQLTVVTKDSIHFDLWKAKALLLPNSSVALKLVDGKFLPKANLHGSLSIGVNKAATDNKEVEGKKSIDFKGITFQNLQLQTVSPVIAVESMGYSGTVGFSNFPVSISKIDVAVNEGIARIDFDLGINLMESIGAGATARIGIKGKMVEDNFKQSWKYDGLDLSAIAIKCEFSGLKINGSLILMENHPTYGNGFNADLEVNVVDIVTVKSKAIFGRTTFRYWYFDASVKWPSVPSPFMINGFGGGAYYKMKRNPNVSISEFSPSGLSYTPDETIGLGVKALVYFHIGKEEVCDGEAGFEVSFTKDGALGELAIFGKANIMAKIPGLKTVGGLMNKVTSTVNGAKSFMGVTETSTQGTFASRFLPKAKEMIPGDLSESVGIKVATAIQFDFQNNAVHGTLDVFINTPGNFLSGIGAGGRAGWAIFHKDPKDWYLYIGTPGERCGIKIGVAGMYLQTDGYFMTGTELPGSPPPSPDIVSQILGVDAQQLNYMRDENVLANGGGFAFGAKLDFDTGDLAFLIFYANFKAGIGFDIMLKDYGEARCRNTGDTVGINGWYANGQSYAYLQGELGVRVKLLFVNLKIPIISAGAAVLMQAKLPNPVWIRGYVGGYMDILGGLIKGRFRFKMTIGEECIFENAAPLGGIKLITDVSPKKESTDVDVFAVPQATFAMKVNEAIVIPEDDGDQTYKIILEKFKVYDGTTEIPGTINWTSMKDRADFVSTDILPPHKKLKVVVEVSFQKMVNGVFQPMYQDGKLAKETEERSFTTGGAPNYIPLTNIEYSYPLVDQKYFLEEEYGQGYIQLKRGQDYLFDDPVWQTEVKMREAGQNQSQSTDFTYNTSSNQVSYNLPDLNQSKNYAFAIVSKNTQGTQNSGDATSTTTINTDDNDVNITTNNAASLSKEGEIERIGYAFATSKYKTFANKMNAINNEGYNFGVISSDVIYLSNTISSQEAFEVVDLNGTIYSANKPLINASATLQDDYFGIDINPNIYSSYPFGGKYEFTHRSISELGNPPAKALPLSAYYMLSIENDVNPEWTKENFPFKYNLPLVYKEDWMNLYNQIVNDNANGIITTAHPAYSLLTKDYLFMRAGFYNISLKYNLPGDKKTSNFYYRFKNPNNFR
jgi:hypothetical protein